MNKKPKEMKVKVMGLEQLDFEPLDFPELEEIRDPGTPEEIEELEDFGETGEDGEDETGGKIITNELVIKALMQFPTVREAAQAVGTTEQKIYEHLKDDKDFKEGYRAAKAEALRELVYHLRGEVKKAIEAVSEIMQDKEINPATRLQAAQTLFSNAEKFEKKLHSAELEHMRTGTIYDS